MDLVVILIYLCLAIIAIGLLTMLAFGMWKLFTTRQSKASIAAGVIAPVLIFGITYAVIGNISEAGIWTALIMLGIGLLGLVASSARGLLGI